MRFLCYLLICLLLPGALTALAQDKKLVIYSAKSFSHIWKADNWLLKKQFEEKCACKIEFYNFDGANTIISKLIIEGERSPADLIIGIDNNLKDKLIDLGLVAPHQIDISKLSLPTTWDDRYFAPYDYGYLAFIYNSKNLPNPPTSFKELITNPEIKIIIQDPRSSSLGLGLVYWIKLLYQDKSYEIWRGLKHNILTVTKSWSDSYNLFSRGEADMMLSYSTSPAYNIMHKNNHDTQAVNFPEGHFLQIELMAKLASSKNQALANLFMEFVLSKEFQAKIAPVNYMYPVVDVKLPAGYDEIPVPKKIITAISETVKKERNLWVGEWLRALIK